MILKYLSIIILRFKKLDKHILSCSILLLIIGIIFSISVSPFVAIRIGLPSNYFIYNHIIYSILALIIIMIFALMDSRSFFYLTTVLTIIFIILLIYIPLFAIEVKGAKRWLYIFHFSVQPSEFVKIMLPLIFSHIYFYCFNNKKGMVYTYLLLSIFYVFIITLLLLQPDLGMSFLIILVFTSMLFITNIPIFWMMLLSFLVVTVFISSYFIFPHVNNRVNAFLFNDSISYQINKALASLSSGKIFGKGAGLGYFKQYLPDAHTDFIFTVTVEELGFVFGVFIISIYSYIFYRSYKFIKNNINNFYGLAVFGLSMTLVFQVIIHVSSNINLIPTKGMTLPLISYGGSSMISTSILIGMLLFLTRRDNFELSI